MYQISRRKWLAQSGVLCIAGDPLLSLSATTAGPLRAEFRLYRVRVDGESPLGLNRGNLVLNREPPLDLTACMSDLAPGLDSRYHFTAALRERLNSIRDYDIKLLYWFGAFLQRGDVVLCYDDSETCRVAAVTGGYSFNANGPQAHVRPLTLFPATIPRHTLFSTFLPNRPNRALHEASDPIQWLNTEVTSVLETIIGARLQCRAATGLGPHCSYRLERRESIY